MPEDVFARVDGGAEELRSGTDYRWDNARRSDANRINIQRTLSGEAFWEDDNARHRVPVGKAMLFTHRERSRYGFPATASEPYRHRYLSIDPAPSVVSLFKEIRANFGSVALMPSDSEAGHLFDELFDRFKSGNFRDRYHECELIVRLLIALYREQVEGRQSSDPIEYGFHLLQNQFRSPISLKTVAQRCGVSREHFIRSYSARYGETPGSALRSLRLSHAVALVQTTGLTISEIAKACGYSSANVFCRAFRQAHGTPPARYRADIPKGEADVSDKLGSKQP